MSIREALLPEFDQEMAITRRTLERVPDGKSEWKPHATSGELGWLAGHVATLPGVAKITITQDEVDLANPASVGGAMPPQKPITTEERLQLFDKLVAEARAVISQASDAEFTKPWTLLMGGKKLFTVPKEKVIRSFFMNHLIHHRAQLCVYLRLNDIPYPPIYGPAPDA